MDSSICVAVITGLPPAMQSRMMFFLQVRQVLEAAFVAEIPTRHHDRPRPTRLSLPDCQPRTGVSILAMTNGPAGWGSVPHATYVMCAAYERNRQHVDTDLNEGIDSHEVLSCRRRHPQPVCWEREYRVGLAEHRRVEPSPASCRRTFLRIVSTAPPSPTVRRSPFHNIVKQTRIVDLNNSVR